MFGSKENPIHAEYLSGAPFLSRLLSLPANKKIVWKALPGTNVLAYLAYS
jgi:hypothetical protein